MLNKTVLEFVLVGVGGAAGAMVRYLGYLLVGSTQGAFPWATLLVNVIGCFLYGILIVAVEQIMPLPKNLVLLLSVGFLASFTTFSTFGFETFYLIQGNQWGFALINVMSQVLLGLAAVYFGHWVMKAFI